MSEPVDTSAEEVERIARWHDTEGHVWASDGANHELRDRHRATAALLRALAAERDAEASIACSRLKTIRCLDLQIVGLEEKAAAYVRGWREGRDAAAMVVVQQIIDEPLAHFHVEVEERDMQTAAAIRALEPPAKKGNGE